MISFSSGLGSLQGLVLLALAVAAFGLQAFALFDAVRRRAAAFTSAGKQTKRLWLIILVVSAAIGFVSLTRPLNMFNLLAVVAAGVYLADVRPAVTGGGGGSGTGSYGGW